MQTINNVPPMFSRALALHQGGNIKDAEALYLTILQSHPNHADTLKLLGTVCLQGRRYEEAVRWIGCSLEINPSQADAHTNHGLALHYLQRSDEALKSFEKAIALAPNDADAYYNRGLTLQTIKRYEDALASYDKAISLTPGHAEAHNNRGEALRNLKRYDDAIASYDKAVTLKPGFAEAYNNRGNALQGLKKFEDALTQLDKAIEINPRYAKAYLNRGGALHSLGRYDNALANYDRAIVLKPDYAEAYYDRGNTLRKIERYNDAVVSYKKSFELNPDIPYLMGALLQTAMRCCNWQGLGAVLSSLAKGIEAGKPSSLPFPLMASPLSGAQQLACAKLNIKDQYPPSAVPLWNREPYAHSRIRIGYFSSDLRNHPVSHLMAGVFEAHDRSNFEVTAFSFGPPVDNAMYRRLVKSFEHFLDVSHKSDRDIAMLARNLEIDIAIDLNGFTQDSRTGIFAMRPAPVQVNYLGYPGTMGASYIDYIIADAFVIPLQSQMHYSEKVVLLPECFQANDDKRFISKEIPSRAMYGLPEEGFVFCSFNNAHKLTPEVFNIWMRLLNAVPGSILWLWGDSTVQSNLRVEAKNRGVEPARLHFAPFVEYEEHLTRLRCAELFLDTLPFNAGATASDALWAGVPLLTCVGETFAARMAGSLLTAVGVPELITTDLDHYESLAIELATHPHELSAIRRKLEKNRTSSPLFNSTLFTKHIESAYITMWERAQAGLPPADIRVQATHNVPQLPQKEAASIK